MHSGTPRMLATSGQCFMNVSGAAAAMERVNGTLCNRVQQLLNLTPFYTTPCYTT